MRLKLAVASSVVALTLLAGNGAGASGIVSPASSPSDTAANRIIQLVETDYPRERRHRDDDWREHRRRDDDDWRERHRDRDNWWRRWYWRSEYREHDGYGYCQRSRHECAERWGWGGWDFRRCVERHGC
jgi:hypothetical protein